MRPLTNVELIRLKSFTEFSVQITLIEPTTTGLNKSIMDATGPVRSFLFEAGIHNYQIQKQGPEHKVVIKAKILNETKIISSIATLYRPKTKKGDPRIWFKGLHSYTSANDVIGIIVFENILYVLNVTKLDIVALLNSKINNPLQQLINEINSINIEVPNELLSLLRQISKKGPIPALLDADTAVGRTLETLLGIEINSFKKPDYKGIELKSFRDKKGIRKSLFAQVPDWKLSKFKSSQEILNNFGYNRGSDVKLYCTVSTLHRNSQGLILKIENNLHWLYENSDKLDIGNFAVWTLEMLHHRLIEKHSETFWITADSLYIEGKEHFIYKNVEHTKKPIVSQFDILLEQGLITLDHLIKRTLDKKVVEKGPLFKIKSGALNLLFPPSQVYELKN